MHYYPTKLDVDGTDLPLQLSSCPFLTPSQTVASNLQTRQCLVDENVSPNISAHKETIEMD